MALVASVVLSLAAIFAQQQAVGTEQNLHHLRLRSLLSIRESLARSVLSQANLYNCPAEKKFSSACTPKLNEIKNRVELAVPGCVFAPGATVGPVCGIVVDPDPSQTYFDTANATMHLRLMYNGADASLASIGSKIELAIDSMVAKTSKVACTLNPPHPTPFFVGLYKNGDPICEGFGGGVCGSHQYIRSFAKNPISKVNFAIDCQPLRTSPVSCGFEEFIGDYIWNGDNSYTPDCLPFRNPFAVWPAAITL